VPRSSGGSRSRGAGQGPVPRRRARRGRRARRTPSTVGSSINRHGRAASSPGGAKAHTQRSSSSVKTNTPKGRCPASRPETRRGQDRSSGPAPGSTARTAGQAAAHPPRTTGPGSTHTHPHSPPRVRRRYAKADGPANPPALKIPLRPAPSTLTVRGPIRAAPAPGERTGRLRLPAGSKPVVAPAAVTGA
jgi:hypothetical protein